MFVSTIVLNTRNSLHEILYGKIEVDFVEYVALKKYELRGQESATLKNMGRSKKREGRTAVKNRAVVWQW